LVEKKRLDERLYFLLNSDEYDINIGIYTCMHIYKYMFAYVCIHVDVHMYIYMYEYIQVYACIYSYAYTHLVDLDLAEEAYLHKTTK